PFSFIHHLASLVYSLSLHDALPISWLRSLPWRSFSLREQACSFAVFLRCKVLTSASSPNRFSPCASPCLPVLRNREFSHCTTRRSEEHTSELQSLRHLVCRLPLEKK